VELCEGCTDDHLGRDPPAALFADAMPVQSGQMLSDDAL
jgi:hypothetical protein